MFGFGKNNGTNDMYELAQLSHAQFLKDFGWQEKLYKDVKQILGYLVGKIKGVAETDIEEDRKTATDFICELENGSKIRVAVRIRKNCKWRDLTIRYARLDSLGRRKETEYQKLAKKKGTASLYLYIWMEKDKVCDYALIDIEALRDHGVFDDRTLKDTFQKYPKWNDDRTTSFVSFSVDMLYELGSIIYSTVNYTGSGVYGAPHGSFRYEK